MKTTMNKNTYKVSATSLYLNTLTRKGGLFLFNGEIRY